jgi:hypothetical protein
MIIKNVEVTLISDIISKPTPLIYLNFDLEGVRKKAVKEFQPSTIKNDNKTCFL